MVFTIVWLTLGLIAGTMFFLIPTLREEVKADARNFIQNFVTKFPHWDTPEVRQKIQRWFFWGQPLLYILLGLFSLIEAAAILMGIRISAAARLVIFGLYIIVILSSCGEQPRNIHRGVAVEKGEAIVVEINPNTIRVLATVPDKRGIKKAHSFHVDSIVYDGYNSAGELTKSFVTAFKGGKAVATIFYSRATLSKDFWHHGSK